MLAQGIIEKVVDRATPWCAPMVVQQKPNGRGIRITVDLSKLNAHVKRPVHPSRSPAEVISSVKPKSRFFSTLDAKSGYHQIPLHDDSRDYTTFITPFGKFRYTRSPQGYVASGDKYNSEGDDAVRDLEGVHKIVDDMLGETETFAEHEKVVENILIRCRKHRITLNPDKFHFAKPEVKFAGFIVGREGTKADPDKVKAIAEFKAPTNITELRGFVGLVNQLAQFVPNPNPFDSCYS